MQPGRPVSQPIRITTAHPWRGATLYQITTQRGLRASTSRCYLRPARKRVNLRVETHAHVSRVLFDGNRATGVEYFQNGRVIKAHVHGEVILSGGAINTPQLLQLSGIGPAEILQRYGIEVKRNITQVGRNLQDHLGVDNSYRSHVPSLNQQLRPLFGKIGAGLQYLFTRTGPLSLSLNQGGGFVRVMEGAKHPDLQLYFSPVSYTRAPVGTRPLMSPDPFPGFLLGFNPCKPTSKGHLQIGSPDPMIAPKIHANYLDTDYDRKIMLEGMKLIRTIAATPALSSVIDQEIAPGPDVITDEQLADYIREKSWTVFHLCGTCRMGTDPGSSVVDPRLRVHGVDGLRVVDASIFPTIPTGNTNAPAIMVGERGADLIREDAGNSLAAIERDSE